MKESSDMDALVKHLSAMIDLHSRRLDAQAGSISSISRILEMQDKQHDLLTLRIKKLEKRIESFEANND